MQIIKSGNTVKTITCLKCQCEFSYTDSDIQESFSFIPFTDIYMPESYLYCPECKTRIDLIGYWKEHSNYHIDW